MKKIFLFVPFLFNQERRFLFLGVECGRDYVETVCQDNTGIYFLTTEEQTVTSDGKVETEVKVFTDSLDKDFESFKERNGIIHQESIVYLN